MRPSSFSMIAVLQFTLYAGAATATCTPSATFLNSKLASPFQAPSSPQQSIVEAPRSVRQGRLEGIADRHRQRARTARRERVGRVGRPAGRALRHVQLAG